MALFKIFLLATGVGVLYGTSLFALKMNFILIPFFGLWGLMYAYHKNVRETNFNLLIRALFGLLCSLQVFVAVIVDMLLVNRMAPSLENIVIVTEDYFRYLFDQPWQQLAVIVPAIGLFLYGTFHGKTFKLLKVINKAFMKREGDIYYKRDGRILDIYIKDPAEFDEGVDKFIAKIPEGCYMERDGKKVKALFLPREAVESLGVSIRQGYLAQIDGRQYYKISIGDSGSLQPSVFPCLLVCSVNKEVELIRVEL